jgi:hypothetical protein
MDEIRYREAYDYLNQQSAQQKVNIIIYQFVPEIRTTKREK